MLTIRYLSAGPVAKGDLSRRFANPTPLALGSFAIGLTTLAMQLMGFRGASNVGALTTIGAYYFVSGVGLTIAGILEWILGNTFPFVVFIIFGGFWYSFATFINPQYLIDATLGGGDATKGVADAAGNASFGLYLVMYGVITLIFLVVALRTNVVFVWIFLTLAVAFFLLAGAYFNLAMANVPTALTLVKAGGALGFLTAMGGWYLFIVQMLATVDYPFSLPVGDLSWFMARKTNIE